MDFALMTPTPPSVPREVGVYRIERLLGTGGMSEVYRAFDTQKQRAVAIKRLAPEAADQPRTRKRFRREARSMVRIRHPSVVEFYDVLEAPAGDWIVMELIEGETLAEHLDEHGPFEVERGRRLALQIAEGLEAAHARGVIHRDLKTENVFLVADAEGDERARLFDFGLAKDLWESGVSGAADGTEPGAMVGTCRGMSPEQALSKSIDHRADLFSFGVLLYELLTDSSPFDAPTPLGMAEKVIHHEPESVRALNPKISPTFSRLIDRLLSKNPQERPASASQVAAALAAMAPERASQTGLQWVVHSIRQHFAGD